MGREEISPVGSMASNFTLLSASGEKISLRKYRGKKNVILVFHPPA